MKRNYTIIATILFGSFAFGQVGIDTQEPKATLDIVARPTDNTKIDGVIAPRLKGSELKGKDGLYTTDQTGTIVYVTEELATADTTPKTVNVTSVGYYYFDGAVWQKLTNANMEPWYDIATNTPATENTQNIYQLGSIAIGKNNMQTGAVLDVNGAVRGGAEHTGSVGTNSAAFGFQTIASGTNSVAFGQTSQATGLNSMAWGGQPTHGTDPEGRYAIASGIASTAWGYGTRATTFGATAWGQGNRAIAPQATAFGATNTASGYWSTAFGQRNIASGNNSLAFGTDNIASGARAVAFGFFNVASGSDETVFGKYNAITSSSNALLQIGMGTSESARANALTILKNGKTGIGILEPQATLHVINNITDLTPVIIEGCNEYTDNAAALAAGLPVGALYRTGDVLKVVH